MNAPPSTRPEAGKRALTFLREEASHQEVDAEALESIGRILKERSGFSLESYKDKCIKRRIAIRIRATESESAEGYAALLARDDAEQERLLRVLTIHVSHFFRNPSVFAKLSREIIPPLLASRPDGAEVRFWSVGCASGEEPYTLALIMRQRFLAELRRLNVSILGTDVDQATLETAQAARYGVERLGEVSERQLARWFVPVGNKYELKPEVRGLVRFERADVTEPGAFPKSDLILCRNVLIYFERHRQEAILSRCIEALPKGGVLVLGKSETLIGEPRRRLETVCPVERVYRVVK